MIRLFVVPGKNLSEACWILMDFVHFYKCHEAFQCYPTRVEWGLKASLDLAGRFGYFSSRGWISMEQNWKRCRWRVGHQSTWSLIASLVREKELNIINLYRLSIDFCLSNFTPPSILFGIFQSLSGISPAGGGRWQHLEHGALCWFIFGRPRTRENHVRHHRAINLWQVYGQFMVIYGDLAICLATTHVSLTIEGQLADGPWGITIPRRAGHATVALIGAIGLSVGFASLSMVAWHGLALIILM